MATLPCGSTYCWSASKCTNLCSISASIPIGCIDKRHPLPSLPIVAPTGITRHKHNHLVAPFLFFSARNSRHCSISFSFPLLRNRPRFYSPESPLAHSFHITSRVVPFAVFSHLHFARALRESTVFRGNMSSTSAGKEQQTPQWVSVSFPDHLQLQVWTIDEQNALLADITSFLQSGWPPMDGTEGHRGVNMV